MAKLIPDVYGFAVEGTPYVVEPYPHLLAIDGRLFIDRLEWIAYDPERHPRHRSSIRFDSLTEALKFWASYETPAERQRRELLPAAAPVLTKQLRAA